MTNEFNPDWMCVCGDLTALGVVHRKDGPCYYPEPKREWVGLTKQEIRAILESNDWTTIPARLIWEAEAKLKEKNTRNGVAYD
jgi:hypothetical protein